MAKQEKFGVLIEGKETVSRAAKKSETGMKKLGSAISAVKVHTLAFVAALYTAIRVLSSSVKAYAQQEQAVARLSQALKNQNNFSQHNIKLLTDQAKALQKLTVFGDEQIISAQAMLTSFALTTEQIKKMTPRMLDVATMTAKTTGEMMDLEGAAKFVGMALGGQAGRLTQAGIRLTDYQKQTFQAANETERFNMLIKIFDQNAAGLAISVGETATGSVKKLKNAFFDLNEQVGKALLKQFGDDIKELTELMRELTGEEKQAAAWREKETKETKRLSTFVTFLGIAIRRLKEIKGKLTKQTKELTEEEIAYGNALLDNLTSQQEQIRLNKLNEEGNLKLSDSVQAMADKIERQLEVSTAQNDIERKIIITRHAHEDAVKKLTKAIKEDNIETEEEKQLLNDMHRLRLREIDDIRTQRGELEQLSELERERAAGVTGLDPGQGRAPRAVDIGGGKWGAPSSDEV